MKNIIEIFNNYFQDRNLKTLSVNNWKNIFSQELSQVFTTRPYTINPDWLYRARLNIGINNSPIDFFTNTTDLWAPPHEKVKAQGRCNTAGQSLLFCSSCPTTTIFELKPETGSQLTIMEYKTI